MSCLSHLQLHPTSFKALEPKLFKQQHLLSLKMVSALQMRQDLNVCLCLLEGPKSYHLQSPVTSNISFKFITIQSRPRHPGTFSKVQAPFSAELGIQAPRPQLPSPKVEVPLAGFRGSFLSCGLHPTPPALILPEVCFQSIWITLLTPGRQCQTKLRDGARHQD